jgi:Ca2+-binding RTX toxin-like protein
VTFYVSSEDSFGLGAWDAVGRYNLAKLGKQVPRNLLVHNNRIYFSAFNPAGKGRSLTAVFQVGGEFSGERLETISPAFWIATDGDDGNNGESLSTPWQTVTRFADQAVTYGSIVLIAAGQYPVANDLSLDFSSGQRPGPTGLEVVIRGEGPGATTIAFGPSATQGFQSKEPSSDRFVLEMLTTTGNCGANHYGSVAADTILGGAGIDKIYGYAGDDTLDGGQGDDMIIGDSGKDTFSFPGANGMDTIAYIELSSVFIRLVVYGFSNPYDLFINQQGSDTVIDLTNSGGGRITLVGISATQLGNSHFVFE